MDDLFGASDGEKAALDPSAPLAARVRPRSLEEYVGQQHILGPGKLLRRAIESDRLTSIILYGPPGIGKTSLAQIIASTTESHFERLSGVESSVADIRRVAAAAALRRASRTPHGDHGIVFFQNGERDECPRPLLRDRSVQPRARKGGHANRRVLRDRPVLP